MLEQPEMSPTNQHSVAAAAAAASVNWPMSRPQIISSSLLLHHQPISASVVRQMWPISGEWWVQQQIDDQSEIREISRAFASSWACPALHRLASRHFASLVPELCGWRRRYLGLQIQNQTFLTLKTPIYVLILDEIHRNFLLQQPLYCRPILKFLKFQELKLGQHPAYPDSWGFLWVVRVCLLRLKTVM